MSNPDRLALLISKRDLIEEAIGTGKNYVEMEIRGRRVKLVASLDQLKYLNEEIDKLESVQSMRTRGPARNRVELRR